MSVKLSFSSARVYGFNPEKSTFGQLLQQAAAGNSKPLETALKETLGTMRAGTGDFSDIGFTPVIEDGDWVVTMGSIVLLALNENKKIIPAQVLKVYCDKALRRYATEAQTTVDALSRSEVRKIKAQTKAELSAQAFSLDTRYFMAFDVRRGLMALTLTTDTKCRRIKALLSGWDKSSPFEFYPLKPETSIAARFADFLTHPEKAPFEIGNSLSVYVEKSTIKANNEDITSPELLGQMLSSGRQVDSMQFAHGGCLFSLNQNLIFKGIKIRCDADGTPELGDNKIVERIDAREDSGLWSDPATCACDMDTINSLFQVTETLIESNIATLPDISASSNDAVASVPTPAPGGAVAAVQQKARELTSLESLLEPEASLSSEQEPAITIAAPAPDNGAGCRNHAVSDRSDPALTSVCRLSESKAASPDKDAADNTRTNNKRSKKQ